MACKNWLRCYSLSEKKSNKYTCNYCLKKLAVTNNGSGKRKKIHFQFVIWIRYRIPFLNLSSPHYSASLGMTDNLTLILTSQASSAEQTCCVIKVSRSNPLIKRTESGVMYPDTIFSTTNCEEISTACLQTEVQIILVIVCYALCK